LAHTIEQLVDQHKVVLDGLLVKLGKVAAAQLDQAVEKLEDEGGVGVALGDGHQVDVLVLDMAEGGAAQRQDGRPHLRVGDDLDAEDVGQPGAAVVAEGAEDEVLALLVEDEDSRKHFGGCGRRRRRPSGGTAGVRRDDDVVDVTEHDDEVEATGGKERTSRNAMCGVV